MATSERVRNQDGARGVSPGSSASGLSSPPRSSPEAGSPSAQFANDSHAGQNNNNAMSSSITVNPAGGLPNSVEKPPRKKPGRKPGFGANKPKINADSSATNTDAPKVRKTRKPRDPNAPTVRRRKNASLENSTPAEIQPAVAPGPPRQPPYVEASQNFHVPSPVATASTSQKGKNEDIPNSTQRPIQSFFNSAPPPPPPQQIQPQQSQPQQQQQQPTMRTSGQNYDPIRSNYDPVRETVISHNPYSNSQGSPSHPHSMNRASASPSISSLVDPPNQALASPSIATQSFFNQQQQARLHRDEGHTSVPPSPTVNRLAPAVPIENGHSKPPTPASMQRKNSEHMASAPGPSTISKKAPGPGSTATSSAAASPKPPKHKEPKGDIFPAPPPLPGSGLMQIGGGGPNDGTEYSAPTVILKIPMNGEVNKYINFTRLAEEQYGWDALHPRLAAQRDRLARVAAAGAALERNGSNKDSGDEMSLDSEGEGDNSNIEMGGMSDGRTGTDGGAKKIPRKRKMKEDEYDKDDGFVDDSELLWEEQAAAANDGFFVYSGPLVPEGEKPALESRGDGPPKRGRGRGSRGGSSRSSGRGGTTAAQEARARQGLPLSGPGSRGGSTTRKPRITKADRARMEQEKLDREKMGSMASMPSNYGGMAQLASAPVLGSTPMVFNQ
ncbi:HPC2-domain-containing protein [Mollisia scopiformis]|uniref:HPC2-domain-containing protein n=1 Tax=Mollisia scopiformis TaxID=149040 RepID=A0A194WSQ4_MOLSC|nr:HPC2-domain-containing protein [Mollisia scopiformis]KUJ10647.1 HPC2-domain-containing protein [Mollisia scopiformis]